MLPLPITYILMGITVIITFYTWNNPSIHEKWIFSPYRIRQRREYYRFLTSGFMHADYVHIFFNMFTFYFFGKSVEKGFHILFGSSGQWIFVAMYLLGIIVSDIPSYFKHQHHPAYRALGASGGVSTIVFASVMLNPTISLIIFPIPVPLPGLIYALLYLVYSAYMARRAQDNINHDAHLYGALFGVVFVLIFVPNTIGRIQNAIINMLPF